MYHKQIYLIIYLKNMPHYVFHVSFFAWRPCIRELLFFRLTEIVFPLKHIRQNCCCKVLSFINGIIMMRKHHNKGNNILDWFLLLFGIYRRFFKIVMRPHNVFIRLAKFPLTLLCSLKCLPYYVWTFALSRFSLWKLTP